MDKTGSKEGQEEKVKSPGSPRDNPWTNLSTDTATNMVKKTVSFSEIVLDETKNRESLQKASNKPLQVIQVSVL